MNDYIKIARPDHWVKNLTIFLGAATALAIGKPQDLGNGLWAITWAFISTFLMASSNYTINELLDAEEDKQHPAKSSRPVPSGKIDYGWGYAQWFLLALGGLIIAWFINLAFFGCAVIFFGMGIMYNVKPLRTKDLIYVDVLSESLNSPIRFLLGWFALKCFHFPPFSLLMCFWMLSAFFMTVKRMSELKYINNPGIAVAYRKPFLYYNQNRLFSGALFYAAVFGFFTGIFLWKYLIMPSSVLVPAA